jgi:hypothetical protein
MEKIVIIVIAATAAFMGCTKDTDQFTKKPCCFPIRIDSAANANVTKTGIIIIRLDTAAAANTR